MLQNGQILDNQYHIVKEIGAGGVGVIYLAYHIRLQKYVVLKKMKSNFVGVVNARSEVDMMKQLHHPYLPQVYDFLQIGQNIYTVIDYIQGHDLEWYIRNKYPFTQEDVCQWLLQLTEVLKYLHSRNPKIIHFDIKPANIIINERNEAVLIDFNISFEGNKSEILGFSKEYASPEQMEYAAQVAYTGASTVCIDERTDIYSLGTTFYHLLTGVSPYVGVQQHYAIRDLEIPYQQVLCNIIAKAMDINPNKRYSSSKEMNRAVQNMNKATWKYRLKILGIVALLLCVSLGVICGILNVYRSGKEKTREEFFLKYNQVLDFYKKDKNGRQLDEAIALLNQSDFAECLEEEPEKKGMLFFIMADAYSQEEDSLDSAIEYYDKAIELCDNSDIYRDYALTLVKQGKYSKAKRMLGKADLPDEEQHMLIGQILCDEGLYEKALEEMEALKDSKDKELHRQALEMQLFCYKELGQDSKAKKCYEELQKLK